jgi:hypothetical protein
MTEGGSTVVSGVGGALTGAFHDATGK